MQLRADRRIGVRLEARVFGSLIDDDSALFCVSSPEVNSCAVLVEGDQLYQVEARVGRRRPLLAERRVRARASRR